MAHVNQYVCDSCGARTDAVSYEGGHMGAPVEVGMPVEWTIFRETRLISCPAAECLKKIGSLEGTSVVWKRREDEARTRIEDEENAAKWTRVNERREVWLKENPKPSARV